MARKSEYEYDIGCVPSTFWFGIVGSNILVPIIALAAGIHVKPDKEFLKAEGPIILIANHESFLDPMVTSRLTHGRKVNFVCGEFLFRKHFWGHVFKLGGAIPKKQFAVDTVAVKAMMKVMKRGGVLVIYPEATRHIDGHSVSDFDDGVAKLAKKTGAAIYVQHIHGAYMTLPRWSPKVRLRRGRITSEFARVISKEEVASLTVPELDALIKQSIDYDENEWARSTGASFRGRDLADGLQNIAYKCLCCGREFAMKPRGNRLICEGCSTAYEYKPDGSIVYGTDGSSVTDLHQWVMWEESEVLKESDTVDVTTPCEVLREQDQFTFVKTDEGTLRVAKGVIEFAGREKIRFETDKLRGIVCDYGKHFEVYDSKGELYRFTVPGNMVLKIQQIVKLR
ncbi:1-acyl-sn-glycerol-3-phosphate acyltransferases [Ruminococcaceae bacterium YRB3002]|nr:1-acyl-sn-glycerol-3-phosphate acyltransferases [Ruminococcaceae bacterium YRB3002]